VLVIYSKPSDHPIVNRLCNDLLTNVLNYKGIYVTVSEPADSLISIFQKGGIKTNMIHFMDCTGKKTKFDSKSGNLTFIGGPKELTKISLVFTELSNTGKYDYVFLDSITSLLLYNSFETTEIFIEYLVGKIKSLGICGIVLSLDESNSKRLFPTIGKICDKIVQI
jgi:hypothetical protein